MIAIPRKVAPSGFPTCLRWYILPGFDGVRPSLSEIVVFSLNSCVMAMPIDAKAREVRSQARNVRSAHRSDRVRRARSSSIPSARWSRATLPLLSNSTLPYLSTKSFHHPPSSFSCLSVPDCPLLFLGSGLGSAFSSGGWPVSTGSASSEVVA